MLKLKKFIQANFLADRKINRNFITLYAYIDVWEEVNQ